MTPIGVTQSLTGGMPETHARELSRLPNDEQAVSFAFQRYASADVTLRVAGTTRPNDVESEARRIADQVWQLGEALTRAKPETLRELLRQAVSRIVCQFEKGETTAAGRTPCKLVNGKVLLRPSPWWSELSSSGNNGDGTWPVTRRYVPRNPTVFPL